mmetsp:Transcript_77261/g.208555  ORF Transcript_77261/g.208555 Transcript_77261/m.208555 type:complete len:83 (-) Transcript_77261:341-589(-)
MQDGFRGLHDSCHSLFDYIKNYVICMVNRMADETNHLNSQEGWDDLVDPVLNPSSDSRSRSLEKQLHAASMFAGFLHLTFLN